MIRDFGYLADAKAEYDTWLAGRSRGTPVGKGKPMRPRHGPNPKLAKRNREIVRRYAAGEPAKAVGAALGLSAQQVHGIVRAARRAGQVIPDQKHRTLDAMRAARHAARPRSASPAA